MRRGCRRAPCTGMRWAAGAPGRRHSPGDKDPSGGESTNAVALEAAWVPAADWQVFARAEWVETHELGLDDDEVHAVAKVSVGARREFPLGEHFRLALGALYTFNDVDRALAPSYGGGNPTGAMLFLQFLAGT